MMSVCTGAFALAAAGLLDGRRAATHWAAAATLAVEHPEVEVDPDVLYVDTGQMLTSAGLAAGIDLCLHVLRLDLGADVAAAVARNMVVPPYREGGQAQFVTQPLPALGPSLAETCAWMVSRLAEPLTIEHMAAHAGWAPRTFARRFVAETGTTPRSLAGRAAARPCAAAPRDHRPVDRPGRRAQRPGHRGEPPAAPRAPSRRHPDGLPPDLPGKGRVSRGHTSGRRRSP